MKTNFSVQSTVTRRLSGLICSNACMRSCPHLYVGIPAQKCLYGVGGANQVSDPGCGDVDVGKHRLSKLVVEIIDDA